MAGIRAGGRVASGRLQETGNVKIAAAGDGGGRISISRHSMDLLVTLDLSRESG